MQQLNEIKFDEVSGSAFINGNNVPNNFGFNQLWWQRLIDNTHGQAEFVLVDKPVHEGVWANHAFLHLDGVTPEVAGWLLRHTHYRGHCQHVANAGKVSSLAGTDIPYLMEPVENIPSNAIIIWYTGDGFTLVTSDLQQK